MDMFKILISPAKSMDFETKIDIDKATKPLFLDQAKKINEVLKKKSPKKLMELMGISDKLAELNWTRNQEWTSLNTKVNSKQAVFAFTGDVYVGLDVNSLNQNQLEILQDKLRILSGLYGILKPLDLIQPYRLEMGSSLKIGTNKDLYQYWKKNVTSELNNELTENDFLINLASNEYFKVIDKKLLKVKEIITPEFKDYKNGELKMIGFFAKKARGLMVRYIIENNINTIEALKGFDYEEYTFDDALSTSDKLVFTR
ncbi:MAG TPA: peroxide stress protein YaaA [Flavobacteriaceae bacterium]|nr:peroxide stress protein YaaA [Flavobacteriaceae bacterium]HEX5742804.1 peroxide stress protein YaaA [Flavobacteriaceae bacterium]